MRNHRFEKWFAKRCGIDISVVAHMYKNHTYTSYDYHIELAWAAWCEATGYLPEGEQNGN